MDMADALFIEIEGRRYACMVVRASRRRSTMALRIRPDASIEVRAPQRMPLSQIEQWLHSRTAWLTERLAALQRLQAKYPRPCYGEGERHLYLGHHYSLQYVQAGRSHVRLVGQRLMIAARRHEAADVRRYLYRWYRQQAREIFTQRMCALIRDIPWLTASPTLAVRMMQRQWGSCSTGGNINLNLHLIKAPPVCIDYVLAHELCHLREHHHGRRFYALLDEVMPAWRRHRQQLNELACALLQD